MFIEILFKMLLFKGGVLIYAEHCTKEEIKKKDVVMSRCRASQDHGAT